jgi:hypothetical protein
MLTLSVIMSDILKEKNGMPLAKLAEKIGKVLVNDAIESFNSKDERRNFLQV